MSTHILGSVELAMGRYDQARARAQASLELASEIEADLVVAGALHLLGGVALVRGAYSEAQAALQTVADMRRAQVQRGREVWALCDLAVAYCGLGQLPQAEQALSRALQIAAERRDPALQMSCVPAAARLCAAQGHAERAVELLAFASRDSAWANTRSFEDAIGKWVSAAAADLPAAVIAAAQERGRARNIETTAEELLAELS
jgi:tetratricopeptide (TPR) repeat protein